MSRPRPRRRLPVLALCALVTACAADRALAPHELFDERSGNTVSVVARPLVFARSRTDVAAYARDYATLVAVELDHSGSVEHYLLLHRWSTVDARMSRPPDPAAGQLEILSSGRIVKLTPLAEPPIGLEHRRDLHLPPHGEVVTHAYRVDGEVLRFIARHRDATLELPQESFGEPFTLWEDGRGAWLEFLRRVGLDS